MVIDTTKSLVQALCGLKVKLYLILDGCNEEFEREITQTLAISPNITIEIIRTSAIGNQKTYGLQIHLLEQERESEFLYFSEDDYLYRPDAFKTMMNALSCDGVDFVSPLDHPDYYCLLPHKDQPQILKIISNHHWRQASMTCLTFMTTPSTLTATKGLLRSYCNGCIDQSMWMGITGNLIWNPFRLVRSFLNYITGRKTEFVALRMLGAIKYLNLKLLRCRHCTLYTPIPSLAVHLSELSLPLGAADFFPLSQRSEIKNIGNAYLSKIQY